MRLPRPCAFRTMLAIVLAVACAAPALASPPTAYADQSQTEAASAGTHIHILPFAGTDAIVLESNGRFGIVDSGEDSDYPDGSDPRYPLRPGIVKGSGVEDAVVAYLKNLGVNSGNLEFYLGTHPHSDHIGSADEIIREFRPQRVYLAEYQDSFISDEARLWDNQYVYDRAIAAAKETGAILIQNLDPNAPVEPAPNPVEAQSDLTAVGDAPQADVLDAEGVMERFGVDPTDQDDPYNSELLPEEGIAVTRSVDPNLIHEHAPDPSTTGSPFFTLGDMNIEIVNYGDDYKFNPVPDANYFSWGVKVKAGGSTAFLAGDINNYDGDEDRLSGMIGHVDLLKLAHHGLSGSNTPSYLTALSPTYAVQTGNSSNLPEYATKTLDRLGVRYFTAPEASANGYGAVVATFARDGLHLNVMKDAATYHAFNHDPRLVLYYQGLKQAYQGWKTLGGSWYWFANSASATQNSWIKQGGTWYWLTDSGAMATGWAKAADGKWYYFEGSGAMRSGGWMKQGSSWYYLSGSGAMQTGWLSKGGSWYWLDPESGRMATGWAKAADGKWYYFEGSGAMRSGGWMKQGSSWYYLSGSGAMQTGWLSKGGSWYWLDPESGRMATGWAKAADGKWYYFEGSGAMRSGGWMKQGGTWYYLNGSGAMHTGWLDLDGKRYYLGESGAMVTGKATIEGETYRFDSSGALLPSDSIMGPSLATVEQMVTLFNAQGVPYPVDKYASRGAATIKDFCQVLLDQARSEDVRAEVLFAQAMVETGWLQFGGDVDRNGKVQCNFGGLGATGNGVAGEEFPDVKTGLLAQAQHLKGYASTAPLNQSCVDTRFGLLAGKRGSAPTVDKLSGTWAADKTYGTKVMNVVDKLLGY
ncbi:glucosaminidase domain-containing protein [Eggerthella sp. BIOML-A5]|uniref:glucosaminidase domain-containing protein n=2 Tax=unclassified Eggerthella TaxID=2648737 RepID=UPI001F04C332|nr:glucosaminidase domain-containing protein [Eggerthella sp. BIOML-A5]